MNKLLYNLLILILILLILLSILLSLFDISKQLILSERNSKISDLIITFSSYLIIILISFLILLSRTLSNKKNLNLIPKSYLPINKIDSSIPFKVLTLILNEYDRISLINLISKPKVLLVNSNTLTSTSSTSTTTTPSQYKIQILNTIPLLQSLINPLLPPSSNHSRAAPLSPLYSLLQSSQSNLIPKALLPLLDLYEEILVRAKYSVEMVSFRAGEGVGEGGGGEEGRGGRKREEEDWNWKEDWDTVIKIVAVVVGLLGGEVVGKDEDDVLR